MRAQTLVKLSLAAGLFGLMALSVPPAQGADRAAVKANGLRGSATLANDNPTVANARLEAAVASATK